MTGTVYLSRDHSGKPGRASGDRGAAADLDGSGSIETDEREANLTPRYLFAAEMALLEAGHRVIPISDGWYSERARRVNQYAGSFQGPQVYVAAHLNAGWKGNSGSGYGSIFYDHRSRTGPTLAQYIAKELRLVAPELSEVKAIAAKPDGWTRNAYATIGGIVQPVGLCFEPCFIDCAEHAELLTDSGLTAIGHALAHGINRYFATV